MLSLSRRRAALALLTTSMPAVNALQLHVKAGPDGTSVGDCPFAHAIQIVAGAKGLPLEVVPHGPDAKPAWLLEQHEGKMPCLVDGERVVTESRTIAAFLEEQYPEQPLSAPSSLEAAEAAAQPVFGCAARTQTRQREPRHSMAERLASVV